MATVILGIDPGLQRTGWGVVAMAGNRLSYLGCGVLTTSASLPVCERLRALHTQLETVVMRWRPDEAAIEETFVNKNGQSTLKLGQARGALLLTLALAGLPVAEYAANLVKKTVTGSGHADKTQVSAMVARLLPGSTAIADAADALAVAICHAQIAPMQRLMKAAL